MLAIYTDRRDDMDLIPTILDLLSIKLEDVFFVYSDISAPDIDYDVASINLYNILNDFNDTILFLNMEDYNRVCQIYNGRCYVLTTKQDLLKTKDTNSTNTTFLIKENNKIRKAKNAELQSILR